jgi:hypothetical protein
MNVINEAEKKIDTFKFSLEEQIAIREATIEAVKIAEQQSEPKEKALVNLKVVGKVNLPPEESDDDEYEEESLFNIISEEELIRELEHAEKTAIKRRFAYVGLKSFVTKLLGSKGYAFSPTYSLINILRDKGVVEIYDFEDEHSYYTPKAIRLKK